MNTLISSLESCRQRVDRIIKNPLLTEILSSDLSVKIYQSSDGSIFPVFPNFKEEQIDAFVLNYRLLIRDGQHEQLSFKSISDLIRGSDALKEKVPRLIEDFESNRSVFNSYLDQDALGVAETETVKNREFIETFVFGFFAHESKAERERLLGWCKNSSMDQLRFTFIASLKRLFAYLIIFESILGMLVSFLRVDCFDYTPPTKDLPRE